MNCKEFRELMDVYVDNELSADAMSSGSAHLSDCQACERAHYELLRLRSALKDSVARHTPSLELMQSVRGIMEPTWPQPVARLFRALGVGQKLTPGAEGNDKRLGFWKQRVPVPAPIFVAFLLAAIALVGWLVSLRLARPSRDIVRDRIVQEQGPMVSNETVDLSRFDHQQRAALYKVRRSSPAEGDR